MFPMRLIATFICGFLFFAPWAFAQSSAWQCRPQELQAIQKIMASQEASWNSGNLEGFMNGYWESDSLKFVGKTGITYGWKATLERYQKGYPDKAAMGKLTFTLLHVERIGRSAAMVTGKWHLQREKDAPQGHFTLLWRKIQGRWVIVEDHSS